MYAFIGGDQVLQMEWPEDVLDLIWSMARRYIRTARMRRLLDDVRLTSMQRLCNMHGCGMYLHLRYYAPEVPEELLRYDACINWVLREFALFPEWMYEDRDSDMVLCNSTCFVHATRPGTRVLYTHLLHKVTLVDEVLRDMWKTIRGVVVHKNFFGDALLVWDLSQAPQPRND